MITIDEKKLKLLLSDRKDQIERPKYSGSGEIISGVSLIISLAIADFSLIPVKNPIYFQIGAWLFSIGILLWGICSLVKSIRRHYSIESLFSEIRDLDPNIEHAFSIVIIKNSREDGKYLLFKSARWKCLLFPNYHCLDGVFNEENEITHIRENLLRDINISGEIDIKYLGNEISHKYSVSDKVDKKYNFHFFQVINAKIYPREMQSFRYNGKVFKWQTLDQMYTNKDIVRKNQDVLDYVRKTCDMN